MKYITEKQKAFIDDMNEFCNEKLMYTDETPREVATDYISRNIDEFKLVTTDSWVLSRGYF